MVVNRELLSKGAQRTLYLDLNTACAAQDQRTTAFTPAVQSYYALAAALTEFADHGGWKARHERYRRLSEQVNDGLQNLGIRPLLTGPQSVVLRSYRLPDGMTYENMHDRLKQHGFVIYAGQGALFPEIFRISTMGTVDDADVSRLLSVIADAIQT